MVGVGRDQPAAPWTRHHVQVVEVVAGTRGHGVIAARDKYDVAVADLDRFVQGAVVGVDELNCETLGSREPVVVRLLEVGLTRRVVGVVLVRRGARSIAPRGPELGDPQRLRPPVLPYGGVDGGVTSPRAPPGPA